MNDEKKKSAGQPTKYNNDMQFKADMYLYIYESHLEEVVPSHCGLAVYLDVNKETLYEWKKHHPKFSNTLQNIKRTQEQCLINKGLSGKYNPAITKLMLANHNYSEKTDINHGGQSDNPVITKIIREVVRADQDSNT